MGCGRGDRGYPSVWTGALMDWAPAKKRRQCSSRRQSAQIVVIGEIGATRPLTPKGQIETDLQQKPIGR